MLTTYPHAQPDPSNVAYFGCCHSTGLRFGDYTPSSHALTAANWGNRTIRTATRRRHAGRQLLMLPTPPCVRRRENQRAWLRCPWAVAETNRQHTNDKHRPIGGHAAAGDLAGHSNAGDLAGCRPRAHQAARPDKAHATPRNSNTTQQLKPQKRNEKHPLTHQYSQLHSNMPKSHMGNMRAS